MSREGTRNEQSSTIMPNMTLRTIVKPALLSLALFAMTGAVSPPSRAGIASIDSIRKSVDATIPALMARDGIPGMAVAVAVDGKSYVFNYGIAQKKAHLPVTGDTLFEIGSLSKTFTATMASWAQTQGRLSLADPVAKYMPEFAGTPFGNVTVFNLGTHTPGGLPLQVPDNVTNDAELIRYLRQWRPPYKVGTYRTYSNISIGMLGVITAKTMGQNFRFLAQQQLFPALGLKHTFIDIPASERAYYAWGYTDSGQPIRMKPGMLCREAYCIRTTAADLIRFIQENIDPSGLPNELRQAITETHTGYFQAGRMTQDLIWEQYPYPVALASLQAGNAYKMIFDATPVRAFMPSLAPNSSVWINKTGSTNGFGAYAAFVPSKRLGIVLLANKAYPIPDRVTAAYRILSELAMRPLRRPSP
jgi:beta-lactamase class C